MNFEPETGIVWFRVGIKNRVRLKSSCKFATLEFCKYATLLVASGHFDGQANLTGKDGQIRSPKISFKLENFQIHKP